MAQALAAGMGGLRHFTEICQNRHFFCILFIFVRFSVILLPGLGHGGTPRIHQNAFKWLVLVWFWDIFVFWPSGVAWLA